MKKIITFIIGVLSAGWMCAQTNLMSNGSFEDYSCNFLGCSWEDWTFPLGMASAEENDKIDGSVALLMKPTTSSVLDQEVALADADYEEGRIFALTLHYKVLKLTSGAIAVDCYWEPKPGGDSEKMKEHDADVLQRDIATAVSEGWEQIVIETSKPSKSAKLRVRVKVPKGAQVLFDAFSLVETDRKAQDGGQTDPTDPTEPIDDRWAQEFVWDASAPLTYMNETFDGVYHNMPVMPEGWQNVAAADARPWWGFDETKTEVFDGDGKFVKASAYQFGIETSGEWEMWLVTPALDYPNTASQIFTFDVMGQYLSDENASVLEIYYIDASDPNNVYFENWTEYFALPSTSADNWNWLSFSVNLENQPYIPDAFFIAFRFFGPNGNEGAVSYYVDNVTWGVSTAEGVEAVSEESAVIGQKMLRDGRIVIVRGEQVFDVLGNSMY